MRIKKFTQLNEKLEQKIYYLLTKNEKDGFDEYHHLFDSYNILFDYVICEIYYQLKKYPIALNDFDKKDFDYDLDELFDYYTKLEENYKIDKLVFEDLEIESDVVFEDWMKIRMNAKKYNL